MYAQPPADSHSPQTLLPCCTFSQHTGADPAAVCSACTCALVDAFRPALLAGGITYDPANPASFPLEETAGIIRACSEQYIASMLMANIDVNALTGLSSCTYTPDSVPRYGGPALSVSRLA